MLFLNNIVDNEPLISIITKIELLGFNFNSIEEQDLMEFFVNSSKIINLDEDIVNQTIKLRKIKKIKLPDAIIASTAITYNFTLITRNVADFKDIKNLELVNPFDI
ncbi:MAG: hypothetical protein RLZZ175_1546 [Bacteroidota bacterium]|jgi:predicted nucleic acid-binding protein